MSDASGRKGRELSRRLAINPGSIRAFLPTVLGVRRHVLPRLPETNLLAVESFANSGAVTPAYPLASAGLLFSLLRARGGTLACRGAADREGAAIFPTELEDGYPQPCRP